MNIKQAQIIRVQNNVDNLQALRQKRPYDGDRSD